MKDKIIGSIVKSSRDLATAQAVTGKIVFPDMAIIGGMTLEQINNLTITKVQWFQDHVYTLGFTLSDGQTCRAGTSNNYNNSFDFPADQKIVKVEVILHATTWIGQIIFYGKDSILKKLGSDKFATGPKKTFMIGENERLIGCELEHGVNCLMGVTFLKWTIA